MRLPFTIYDLRFVDNVRLAPNGAYVRRTIYDMGVQQLRREFGKRKGFLSSVIMMTAYCHDF